MGRRGPVRPLRDHRPGIDFVGRESVGFLEGMVYAINLFATPFFLAMVVAGIGRALRLFALYTVKDEV